MSLQAQRSDPPCRRSFRYDRLKSPVCGILIFLILILACSIDHGLGPTVQGIRGTVYFDGAWPDSILEARVAVFETYPVESFLELSGYSDSIPLASDSAAYEVRLTSGEYAFVVVVCRSKPSWNAGCMLGFYHMPAAPHIPQAITVESGEFLEGIDINVEFTSLWPEAR